MPQKKYEIPKKIRPWVLPVFIVLVWWWVFEQEMVKTPLLVSPVAVWERGVLQVRSGELWQALFASLQRNLWGLVWGVSVGLSVGILLGFSRWMDRLIGPTFHTFKQISLFAWIPMLTMWFGVGEAAKVAFIAMAAFFPVVLNTHEGIRSIPKEWVEVAKVYEFNFFQLLVRVIAPAAAPSIFTGIQLALIYTWLATLGAEYLMSSGQGIGNTLIDGREHFQMDLVLLGVVVIGVIGSLLNAFLGATEQHLLRWRERSIARF